MHSRPSPGDIRQNFVRFGIIPATSLLLAQCAFTFYFSLDKSGDSWSELSIDELPPFDSHLA